MMKMTSMVWWQSLFSIYCLFLLNEVVAWSPERYYPEPYDHPYHINVSGLSITSVIYNPSTSYSSWVSRIFGETAIFHNRSYGFRSAHPLTPQEKLDRSYLFQRAFRLPSDALLPSCSIEILGYVPVDRYRPFTFDDQMNEPSLGKATLQFPILQEINDVNRHLPRNMTWTCYYRAMYENTLKQHTFYVKQYWPVFLFCPAPKYDHSCLSMLHLYHQEFVRQLKIYWKVLKIEQDQVFTSREKNNGDATRGGNAGEGKKVGKLNTAAFFNQDGKKQLSTNQVLQLNKDLNTTDKKLGQLSLDDLFWPVKKDNEKAAEEDGNESPDTEKVKIRRILSKSPMESSLNDASTSRIQPMQTDVLYDGEHEEKELSERLHRHLATVNYVANRDRPKKRRNKKAGKNDAETTTTTSATSPSSPMDYKQFTNIVSSPISDFRELYTLPTPIYPTSALAYLSAVLTSPLVAFSRLNFPKPVFEYQVSNALLAIVSRLQRLVEDATIDGTPEQQQRARKIFYTSQISLPLKLTMFLGERFISTDYEEVGDYFIRANETLENRQSRLRRTEESTSTAKASANSWSVNLQFDLVNSLRKKADRKGESSGTSRSKSSVKQFHKAVCTVIPYTMKDGERTKMNGWMVYEFVRYYSRLGFLVMMYDREGDNLPYINKYFDFETTHGTRFQTKTSESTGDGGSTGGEDEEGNGDASVQENEPWNLRYYDFTIMQLLRLYPSNIVYNNKDGIIDRAIIRSDFDKRLTLTQCRYSAKQLYGIEEVLVVDFDEFLYCPRATLGKKLFSGGGNIGIAMGPSRRLEEENQVDTRNLNSLTITTPMPNVAQQQRDFYDAYTLHLMNKGIDQFILKQRVVVSKYGDMRECLMQQYYDMEAYVTAHTIGHNSTLKFAKNQVEYPLPLRPSLFHCISSFHYGIKMFFEKTQHLSHACPYTSFHYASNLRQFDCHTTSYMSTSKTRRHYHTQGCSVIHITTKSNQYNRTHNYDWNKIMNEEYNQLYALSYGPWN